MNFHPSLSVLTHGLTAVYVSVKPETSMEHSRLFLMQYSLKLDSFADACSSFPDWMLLIYHPMDHPMARPKIKRNPAQAKFVLFMVVSLQVVSGRNSEYLF